MPSEWCGVKLESESGGVKVSSPSQADLIAYVAQTVIKFAILLPQSPECLEGRPAPSCPALDQKS